MPELAVATDWYMNWTNGTRIVIIVMWILVGMQHFRAWLKFANSLMFWWSWIAITSAIVYFAGIMGQHVRVAGIPWETQTLQPVWLTLKAIGLAGLVRCLYLGRNEPRLDTKVVVKP